MCYTTPSSAGMLVPPVLGVGVTVGPSLCVDSVADSLREPGVVPVGASFGVLEMKRIAFSCDLASAFVTVAAFSSGSCTQAPKSHDKNKRRKG
ncbi:hypothetical protein F5X99DRAFT_414577 [Biscogniauxia marginata]|nr:hypothetical protein F5X99DRAFT_414577 [Biscogniauxia marginata]